MSRTVGMRTSVGIRVQAMSKIYVANEVLRTNIEIVGRRKLDTHYMSSNLETLSKGYQTWVTTEHLKRSVLEIYDSVTDEVEERWDMVFTYDRFGTRDHSRFKTEFDKLKKFASRLSRLPSGCTYRVVVELKKDAPPVEGWTNTALRSIDHLKNRSLGKYIDTGLTDVCMEYWGRTR